MSPATLHWYWQPALASAVERYSGSSAGLRSTARPAHETDLSAYNNAPAITLLIEPTHSPRDRAHALCVLDSTGAELWFDEISRKHCDSVLLLSSTRGNLEGEESRQAT